MADELVFESTTDTPQQIAEGLGLPFDAPDAPVDTKAAEPVAEVSDTKAAPAVAAAPAATETKTVDEPAAATPERDERGRFLPKDGATKAADAPAAAVAATPKPGESYEALQARIAQLERQTAPVAAPAGTSIDIDTYKDERVAAQYAKQREALGAEPKQDDFDDYETFRRAERTYDRKLAAIDANEAVAHRMAGTDRVNAERTAYQAAQRVFANFNERQNAVKARHADYEAVMAAGMQIPFGKDTPHYQAIYSQLLEDENGPEAVYYLAGHPDELARVQAQPNVYAAMRELGAVIARASAAAAASVAPVGATATGPATATAPRLVAAPTTPRSRAPEPQGTTLGGGSSLGAATTPETAENYQDYKRLREQQIRDRKRR